MSKSIGASSLFRGVGLSDVAYPIALAILAITVALLWRDVSAKQDEIVVLDYARLTDLFTGAVVDQPQDGALEARTNAYLGAVTLVADDYARVTGRLVIMREAVVGGDDGLRDITDYVHARAMAMEEG